MKKILLMILLTGLFSFSISAKDKEIPQMVKDAFKKSSQGSSNSMGKRFMLGFPANDIDQAPKDALDIYVASDFDGEFVLQNKLTGYEQRYTLTKGGVVALTTQNGGTTWNWETREIGKAANKGLEILSDVPVSVYVLMGKNYSSEGYLAIPVSAWDDKYIHCSFWDFKEWAEWKTEFLIIASEDKTRIKVKLKGLPVGAETANPNWKIGQTKTITLDKYQTYLVQGNGKNRGLLDLSGTEITSLDKNKPIGIISGHERTMIPKNIVYNGRDNLLAMLAPVSRWGKEYYTVELDRKTDKGDYFRVVASEDDTEVVITWYDKKTRDFINSLTYKLEANEWIEYHTVDADYNNEDVEGIRGTSQFKANNPILVLQYAYSAWWDDQQSRFDPFFFPVTPVEQYTKSTIFQTPTNASDNDYVDNFFNILAIGDTSDFQNNEKLLSSITIDGKTVRSSDPTFLTNQIPNTKIYWGVVNVGQGPHAIRGDTPFGAYVYGFGRFNSYAWPAAAAFKDLTIVDFEEPRTTIENLCQRYDITATELINYERPDTNQVDTKMSDYPFTIGDVTNFRNFAKGNSAPRYFELHEEENDPKRENGGWYGELDDSLIVYVEILDMKKDASMTFSFVDQRENYSLDSIVYSAPNFELSNTDFGQQRINTKSEEKIITISNAATGSTTITNLDIQINAPWQEDEIVFQIVDYDGEEIIIEEGETFDIKITYTPTEEYYDKDKREYTHKETNELFSAGFWDLNELVVSTSCTEFVYPLIGQGVEPYIVVADWDERNKPVGLDNSVICFPSKNQGKSYSITNWNTEKNRPGSMDLIITGINENEITDIDGNFVKLDVYSIDDQFAFVNNAGILTFNNPITVKAGGQVTLNNQDEKIFPQDLESSELSSLCFTADQKGVFVRNVPFISNAIKGKEIGLWAFAVSSPGPQVNNLVWESKRVLSKNTGPMGGVNDEGFIKVTNSGDSEFRIKQINLLDNADNNFMIDPAFKFIAELTDLDITIIPESSLDNEIDIDRRIYKEFKIPIIFTPQNEYGPTFRVPTARLEFTYNDNTANGLTIAGTIEGFAHLPKVNPTGAIFTDKTLVGDLSEETQFVLIENPSQSAPLRVFAVKWATNTQNTFNFLDVNNLPVEYEFTDIDTPYFVVATGETKRLPLDFTPRVVGENREEIMVISDAVTGDEPADLSQLNSQSIDAVGPGTAIGLTPIGYNYDAILRCDEPMANIEFFVTDEPFFVETIEVTGDANNVFVIDNIDQYIGRTIKSDLDGTAAEPLVIPVQFIPSNDNSIDNNADETPTDYSKSVRITGYFIIDGGNKPNEATAQINGSVYKRTVELELSNSFENKTVGSNVSIFIEGKSNSWNEFGISELSFDFKYREREMLLIGDGMVNNDLAITISEPVLITGDNEEYFTRKITVTGDIQSNFRVTLNMATQLKSFAQDFEGDATAKVMFYVLENSTEFSIEDKNLECVLPIGSQDGIDPEICLLTQRFLTLATQADDINTSQQIISNNLDIEYSIAFDSPTKIEIINSEGEVVSTVIDGLELAGTNTLSIDMSSYGSGVYFVRLTTNYTSKSKEVLLVK